MKSINVMSMVSSRTGEPIVQVNLGKEAAQLTLSQANHLAFNILHAAEAAWTDAMVRAYLMEYIEFDETAAASFVAQLRDYRDRWPVLPTDEDTHMEER